MQLTTSHKEDVKVLVTAVMPLPPAKEKELKETLQEITEEGKKVTVEQKVDLSIFNVVSCYYQVSILISLPKETTWVLHYDGHNYERYPPGDPSKRAFAYFVLSGGRFVYASVIHVQSCHHQ